MLHCRACLSRCIRALETPPLQTRRFRRDGLPALAATQQQRAASSSTGDDWDAATVRPAKPRRRDDWERSDAARSLKKKEDWALRRPVDRQQMKKEERGVAAGEMWLGKRDPQMSESEWKRRKKELQYLHDPLEVAVFVRQELAKGKHKEMLQLVRMASHSMPVVVSWNHIIDHLMKTSVSEAMKVYNEMKKRGQFPDSYTYSIILRGLANNANKSDVVSKAIAVYYSMFAPNSRVEPTIIHTNSALNVCARALDMDALWGIVAKIPEHGPGAADARTYTIILNAIRSHLLVDAPLGEGELELAQRRERGVVQGRRIWEEVVAKWRNADLVIEEELVCAMGRLLLVGSRPRDWDDVLSLVEQTMDVPRLVPRLGTKERDALPRIRAPNIPKQFRVDDDHLGPDEDFARGEEFLALTEGEEGKNSRPLTYASPGNPTLSMVLEACQKIVAPKAADEYWEMLTDPGTYGIVADNNNLHQRLRLLRTNRASSTIVNILQDKSFIKNTELKPGTFRIAMSTCVRDKNNHNSLRNANELLQLMMKTLPDADAKTSSMYAELAIAFPLAKGEDLVKALTYLQPVIRSLRVQLNIGTEEVDGGRVRGARKLTEEARQDAVAALRKIYGVYDRLLLSNLISEQEKVPFKTERARMSALISRITFHANRRSGPRHDGSSGDGAESAAKEEKPTIDETRENPRSARNWRASRAAPPEKRKSWFSPLVD